MDLVEAVKSTDLEQESFSTYGDFAALPMFFPTVSRFFLDRFVFEKASSGWRTKKRYHHHRLVFITFFFFIIVVHSSSPSSSDLPELNGGVRSLKSFKEKGSNITFDCSPSGPCVPCLYHEKKDVSYRCSETGYRIPMKCVKTVDDESNKDRNLSEEMYVTYRSCIPAINQEKLSPLAFEAIMLLLLITSSFVIFRRKGNFVMPLILEFCRSFFSSNVLVALHISGCFLLLIIIIVFFYVYTS